MQKNICRFPETAYARIITFFAVFFFIALPLNVNARAEGEHIITSPFIPDSLISLADGHVIVVDKTRQHLYLFTEEGGRFYSVFDTVCSTGKTKGMKLRSGDHRTPEGIYYPKEFFSDEELTPIYGIMAYDLDYPNIIDRKEGKNGHNIWLHGTNKALTPLQSNGCVTLNNGDIEYVSRYIQLNKTPIIIHDYIKWVSHDVSRTLKDELLALITTWCRSVSNGRPSVIEKCYGSQSIIKDNIRPDLISGIAEAKNLHTAVTLHPENMSILKHDKYAVATFDQVFTVGNDTFNAGMRKLFLKKKLNTWYIDADICLEPEKGASFVASLASSNRHIAYNEKIHDILRQWVHSWEQCDVSTYGTFYASDFRSRDMGLTEWLTHKNNLARLNNEIDITLSNVRISKNDDKDMIVTFLQKYRSSLHSDTGIKTLSLRQYDGYWKIYREVWKPITAVSASRK